MSDVVDLDEPTIGQKLAAEFLGTLVLVFFGCASVVMSQGNYAVIGLTFGLTVVTMAYAFGRVSGGHFNPAVTIGAVLGGRTKPQEGALYAAAQVVGGIVAAFLLWLLLKGFDNGPSVADVANKFGDDGSGYAFWAAFLLEALLTFVFLMVILGSTDTRNKSMAAAAPLAIGFALTMVHFASMGATGTSVNPARSIGPALFSGEGEYIAMLWLFILAPSIGGAAAGLIYPLVFGGERLKIERAAKLPPYQQQWQQGYPQAGYQQGYDQGAHPQQGYDQAAYEQQQQQWQQYQAQQQAQQHPQQGYWQQPQDDRSGRTQQWPSQPPQAQPGQAQPEQARPGYAFGTSDDAAQPPGQQGQPGPQHWGRPAEQDDEEDGRTQIRPNDA